MRFDNRSTRVARAADPLAAVTLSDLFIDVGRSVSDTHTHQAYKRNVAGVVELQWNQRRIVVARSRTCQISHALGA